MAVTDKFYQILEKLSQNPENKDIDIRKAIISWCRELSMADDKAKKIADYAYVWLEKTDKDTFFLYKKLLKGTNSTIFRIISNFTKIPLEKIEIKDYQEIINNSLQEIKEKENKMKTKFILIIGFVLLGVGLTLYLLNQKQKNSNSKNTAPPSSAVLEPPSVDTRNAILVLVINAQHEKLIESLKNKRNITESEGQSLYDATQALWMGDESDFTQLSEWFDEEKSVQNEQSEYDVYLLKIGLIQPEPGFKESANPLDKLDAFRELNNNLRNIEISPRLSNKAYANSIFYNR